ncbi:MAG: hypothetical protein E7003_07055 [Eggerthellaceae bacterium]|nr:hypothetical protein [Eggerthellaceae bacterium]
MASSRSKRVLFSWKQKAVFALILFVCAQVAFVAYAVADRVPPTVSTKDATIEFGETLELSSFVRVNDDRTEAAITGVSVEPSAGTTVSDDLKTVSFEKSGDYAITVSATDESGNVGSGELKVTMLPRPRPEADPEMVASGQAQPDTIPFPLPDVAFRPEGATIVAGEDVPAGLYKLIGTGEKKGRVDVGYIKVTKHMVEDIDIDISILDALAVSGEFYGSKWIYLSQGAEFELDDATYMVAENDVPETLYSQVHLDGTYCAGIDIEPGKYLIQAKVSSEQDAGHWSVAELFDFVVLTYVQDVKYGSVPYGDDAAGEEVWVYRGQFLTIDSCVATKVS